jgi:hypothetical protein
VKWVGSLGHEGLKKAATEGESDYDQIGAGSGDDKSYVWQNQWLSTERPGSRMRRATTPRGGKRLAGRWRC